VGTKQQAITRREGQSSAGWTVLKTDLHRAGISRYNITTGGQLVSLDGVYDRRQKSMEGDVGGTDGWNQLCDDIPI